MSVSAAGSLRERVFKAGSWVLIGHVLAQAIRLATNIVASRLLAPDAFGLLAVVYVLMTALSLFSDTGLNRALVQSHRGSDAEFLDTAWSLQILRGLFMASVAVLVALGLAAAAVWGWTPAGAIYSDPRLPWVIASFAPALLLQAFESVRIELARRHLQQRLLTQVDLTAQIGASVGILAVAWATRSFWSLVVGALAAGTIRCAMSHRFMPGHQERWHLDAASVRELLAQAHWILPASILGFVAINADRVLLGGLIDAHTFGLYAIAYLLVSAVQSMVGTMLANVVYPALSEVARTQPDRLLFTLDRLQGVFDRTLVTFAGCLCATGPVIVRVLYDSRYTEAGWMLSSLALSLIGMRAQIVEQAYLPLGRPEIMTFTMALRVVFLCLAVTLGYRWGGLEAAVLGIALSPFVSWPVSLWFKSRQGALRWRVELHFLPWALLGGLVGWACSLVYGLWKLG